METVELTFASLFELQTALEQVLEGSMMVSHSTPPGTCCLRIVFGGETLEVFALAKPGQYRFTDDPVDLRFQVTAFRAKVEPEPVVADTARPPAVEAEPAAQAALAVSPESAVTEDALPPDDLDEDAALEAALAALPKPAGSDALSGELEVLDAADETLSDETEAPAATVPDETELAELQIIAGTSNPIMVKVKAIQKLGSTQRLKLAEDGDLVDRTLLYRMYGKMVFEALLRNPRISETEVAKLAKLGTIAAPQLLLISRKGEWVRAERIRNALLGNPRLPIAAAQKIVHTLSKHELRPLVQRRDFPPQVQAVIKEANLKLSGVK